MGDVVISGDVLGSGIGRWLGVEYPRPVDPGSGRWLSRDDTWLAAVVVVVVCSFAVVAGCLAVTLTVRGLRGDTGPVVAEVRACAAAILVVGLVCFRLAVCDRAASAGADAHQGALPRGLRGEPGGHR